MKKLLLCAVLTCGITPLMTAWAAPDRHGDGPGRGDDREMDKGRGRGRGDDHGREVHEHPGPPARAFRAGDREVIHRYYAGPRGLPPGLAKKWARTDRLPPGWEKRFRPFPVVVEQELPPICVTCSRGIIDGYAVVFDRRTRIVLDIFALADDIRGR